MAFGVIVYPDLSPLEQIEDYFKLCERYGFTRAIASLLSVEGDNDEVIAYFTRFIASAHEHGLSVSLDVNTNCLKRFGQSYDDISLFHQMGVDILRLDGSYGAENDYVMVQNPYGIRIEMNASSHRVEPELAYFAERGVGPDRVCTCHNAYPQRYTGLKWSDFLSKSKMLRKYPYSVAAIVTSHAPDTISLWGCNDGLPTVERLRDLPIDLQARILLATGGVDDIVIGNAFASEAELAALSEVAQPPKSLEDSQIYKEILAYGPQRPVFGPTKRLRVIAEPDITPIERETLFELVPQLDNGDSSEWIWRSRSGRLINSDRPIPPRRTEGDMFPVGSVVVVNDEYPHYSGELQIVREPIVNDGKRNLVARLAPGEEMVLDLIEANDLVEFIPYRPY